MNHTDFKITYMTYIPQSDAWFEFQQVVISISANPAILCWTLASTRRFIQRTDTHWIFSFFRSFFVSLKEENLSASPVCGKLRPAFLAPTPMLFLKSLKFLHILVFISYYIMSFSPCLRNKMQWAAAMLLTDDIFALNIDQVFVSSWV